jgi:hypothetical protein
VTNRTKARRSSLQPVKNAVMIFSNALASGRY